MAIPAPPAGFTIDAPEESSIPAPPAGFTIDGQESSPVAKKKPGMLEYGLKRTGQGALGIAGAFSSLGEGVARASGGDYIADRLKTLRESQIETREKKIDSDIGAAQTLVQGDESLWNKGKRGDLGAGDVGKGIADLVFQQAPQFLVGGGFGKAGAMLGGAMKTKALVSAGKNLVTKEAAKDIAKGRLAGNLAGTMTGMSAQETGSIYGEQKDGEKDLLKAAITGVPAGMLEGLAQTHTMARSGIGGLMEKSLKRPGRVSVGSATKEGLKTVTEEGVTEGAQNVLEQSGARPGYDLLGDVKKTDWTQVAENVAGGALMGGTMHAAGTPGKMISQKFGDRADARFLDDVTGRTIEGSSVNAQAIVSSAIETVDAQKQAEAAAEQQKIAQEKLQTDPQVIAETQAKVKALDITPAEQQQIQQIYDDPNTDPKNKEKAGALLVKIGDIENTQMSKEQKQDHDLTKMEIKQDDHQEKLADRDAQKEISRQEKLAGLETKDQHTTLQVEAVQNKHAQVEQKLQDLRDERASITGEGSTEAKAKITQKIKEQEIKVKQSQLKVDEAIKLSDMATEQRAGHEHAEAFKTPESAIATMRSHVDEVMSKGKEAWATFKEFSSAMLAKYGSPAKQYLLKVWKYVKSIQFGLSVGLQDKAGNKISMADAMKQEAKPKKTRRLSMKEALKSDEVHQNMLDNLEVQNENRRVEDKLTRYQTPEYKATSNGRLDKIRAAYQKEKDPAKKQKLLELGQRVKQKMFDKSLKDTSAAAQAYREMLTSHKFERPNSEEHSADLRKVDAIQGLGEVEHEQVKEENAKSGKKMEDSDTEDLREKHADIFTENVASREEKEAAQFRAHANRTMNADSEGVVETGDRDKNEERGIRNSSTREAISYPIDRLATVKNKLFGLFAAAGIPRISKDMSKQQIEAIRAQENEVRDQYAAEQHAIIDDLVKKMSVSKFLKEYGDVVRLALRSVIMTYDVQAAINYVTNEANRSEGTWDVPLHKMRELPNELFHLADVAVGKADKGGENHTLSDAENAISVILSLQGDLDASLAAVRLHEERDAGNEDLLGNPALAKLIDRSTSKLADIIQRFWDNADNLYSVTGANADGSIRNKDKDSDSTVKTTKAINPLELAAKKERLGKVEAAERAYKAFKKTAPLSEERIATVGSRIIRQMELWRYYGNRIDTTHKDFLAEFTDPAFLGENDLTREQVLQILDMTRVANTLGETQDVADNIHREFVLHFPDTAEFIADKESIPLSDYPLTEDGAPYMPAHPVESDLSSAKVDATDVAEKTRDVNQLGMVWDEEAVQEKHAQPKGPVDILNRLETKTGSKEFGDSGRHKMFKVVFEKKDGTQYEKVMTGREAAKAFEKNGTPEATAKALSVTKISDQKFDALASDYLGQDYLPTIIKMGKTGGHITEGTYQKIRDMWRQRNEIIREIKRSEIKKASAATIKELRSNQTGVERKMSAAITPIKIALFKEKMATVTLMTPEKFEALADSLAKDGFNHLAAPQLYEMFRASGSDFQAFHSAVNRVLLEQQQAIVDAHYAMKDAWLPATGEVWEDGKLVKQADKRSSEDRPIMPVKSEEEKSAALSRGQGGESLEKFYSRIVKEQPWETTARETSKLPAAPKQNKVIEEVFEGKPVDSLTDFEKSLSEQFSTPDNQVKPGSFRDKIVHTFFEKIAKMFGAKLIVVRDFSGEFKGGYFPNTDQGPVIAVNADSGFSFTRIFAHELFHHALNKISPAAYAEFKAAVQMSVDKKKWDAAVLKIAGKYNLYSQMQPQTINEKGRYGSPFAQNKVVHGKFTAETGSKFAPVKETNKEVLSVQGTSIDYDQVAHAEEELYSELFSHAFMQNEFWEHMAKSAEGKSLAVKLAVQFMKRTVQVTKFLAEDKKNRGIKEIKDLVTDWDGMAWDWADQSMTKPGAFQASRSSVSPGGPVGGIYQALSIVMDQALLSKTLQHGDTKYFTTAQAEAFIKGGAKEMVLNNTWRKIITPGTSSYKDVMTNIENVLNSIIDWIADHKPAGVFEDFRKNRDIVNMMQKLNHAGNLQRQIAMQRVVEKHREAFKDMSEEELAHMHDMMVRKHDQAYYRGLTTAQKEAFAAMKAFLAPIHAEMIRLGIVPENFEFNTNGQVIRWMTKKDVGMGESLDSILRDDISNLKRDERFLKSRKQNWTNRTKTTMEIAEENDLKFRDINPLTMFAKYVEDAQRLIVLKELMSEGQAKGYIKHFKDKGMEAVDDAAFKQITSFTKGGVQVGVKMEDGSMLKNSDESEMRFPDTQSARDFIDHNPDLVGENATAEVFGQDNQDELITRPYFTVATEAHSLDDQGNDVWTPTDRKSFDTQEKADEYRATQPADTAGIRTVVAPAFEKVDTQTKSQLYFHKDMAAMLNVILSEDKLRQGELMGISGAQLMNFKNTMTMLELSLSAFHAFTIGQELVSSYAGWVGQRYGIGKGILNLNPRKAYRESRELNELLNKILEDENYASTPEAIAESRRLLGADVQAAEVFALLCDNGLMMHQDETLRSGMQAWGHVRYTSAGDGKFKGILDSAKGYVDSFHETLEEQRRQDPGGRILPFSKAMLHHTMVGSTAWLMEDGIPKIKAAAAMRELTLKMMKKQRELGRPLTADEKATLAHDTMKFIEDRFGEVNWKNMWLNKSNKTFLQFMFRSFTWVAGSWKALAKAGIDMAKLGWFAAKGEKYEMTEKGYWGMMAVASHVATVAALSIPYSLAIAMGADEQETDEDTPLLTKMLFPRIDPYDNTKRVTVPSYVSEAYKILMHLGMNGNKVEISKMITGRFNSVVGSTVDLIKNEDFKGVLIRDPDKNPLENTYSVIKHILPVPISIGGIYKSMNEGGNTSSAMFSAMGATDAPAGAKRSAATNLAFDLGRREYKGKEMTSDEMDMKDEFKRAMNAYVKGDKSKVDELLAEGKVSERQYKNALERYPILNNEPNPKYKDQLSQAMSRLTVKSALKVYEHMTDVEKERHTKEIDKKISNMRIRKDTPKTEQAMYIEHWNELKANAQ